jgi:hypothetical protein
VPTSSRAASPLRVEFHRAFLVLDVRGEILGVHRDFGERSEFHHTCLGFDGRGEVVCVCLGFDSHNEVVYVCLGFSDRGELHRARLVLDLRVELLGACLGLDIHVSRVHLGGLLGMLWRSKTMVTSSATRLPGLLH